MKGDFTRNTFQAYNHFSRVLMQQGRVQLDADWNEQAAILLHYVQTLARDLIGPYGGPAGDEYGFAVTAGASYDFIIGKGRYYVDGLLCENEADCAYSDQPDYAPLPAAETLRNISEANPGQTYLLYLDVWERFVSYLEDDAIREKALGGPDTAGRAKVVWQVKVLRQALVDNNAISCDAVQSLPRLSRAWLRVRVKPEAPSTDPCILAPDAQYRGAENRLYRIEIHTGGSAAQATFKWSRDNGSQAARWLGNDGDAIIVSSARGFAAGQWVELSDDLDDLRGQPGALAQIAKVESDMLTLNPPQAWSDALRNPKVRRWDYVETETTPLSPTDKALPVHEGNAEEDWLDLEDGIQIQFQPPANANEPNYYRSGDYWIVAARTATGAVEWPWELDDQGQVKRDAAGNAIAQALPPHGIEHHYAPLALITLNGEQIALQHDCRCVFNPLRICANGQ